jgi:peptidoglycan/LPS O-acetylase OafA/YrhL
MRPGQSGDSSAAPSTAPTLAFEEFQAARRFPALDGVRAIAICLCSRRTRRTALLAVIPRPERGHDLLRPERVLPALADPPRRDAECHRIYTTVRGLVVDRSRFSAGSVISSYGIYLAPYVQLVFGCVAALLLHRPSSYDVVARLGRYPVVAVLGVLLVVLQFLVPGTGTGQDLYAPYGVVACLLLIGLVTTTAPWVAWLWSRPMVVTATLSYALYLVHNFGLNFAEKLVPGGHGLAGSLVSTALGLSIAYLIAYGLNRTVERPFISLGHRITQRRRRALGEVSPDRLAVRQPGRDRAHSPDGGPSVLKRP